MSSLVCRPIDPMDQRKEQVYQDSQISAARKVNLDYSCCQMFGVTSENKKLMEKNCSGKNKVYIILNEYLAHFKNQKCMLKNNVFWLSLFALRINGNPAYSIMFEFEY